MKTNKNISNRSAFTLIEMVGVLAVIAILAALLVPKIFAAINDSRFSNTVASVNSCKTASMDYFGKNGKFPASTADGDFGKELLDKGFLERPFTAKVGETPTVSVYPSVGTAPGTTHCYSLNGAETGFGEGSTVVEIVLKKVDIADAWELSKRFDGPAPGTAATAAPFDLTTATAAGPDKYGRVTYPAAETDGTTTVSIYLSHK